MEKKNLLIVFLIVIIGFLAFFTFFPSAPGIEKCKQFEGELRDYCYFEAGFFGQDKACEKIESQDLRERCYVIVARDQKGALFTDPSMVCEKIESNDMKKYCNAVITEEEDACIELCSGIKDQSIADKCYKEIALVQQNELICNKMNQNKSECLFEVFVGKNLMGFFDQTTCKGFDDPKVRGVCWLRIAQRHQDKELCNNITATEIKEECNESIEEPVESPTPTE